MQIKNNTLLKNNARLKKTLTLLRDLYKPAFFSESLSPTEASFPKIKIAEYDCDRAFYVLISTILSQRTRDEVTYERAKALFNVLKIKTAKDLASADTKKIERLIKPVGFYKTKARRIKEVARILVEKYNNQVPVDMDTLLGLPGVGRKTANCVLVYGFRKPAIPVDTHVHRISNRLGIVKTKTPEQTETALMSIVPKKDWMFINKALVRHGRLVCRPVRPKCSACSLTGVCKKSGLQSVRHDTG